ncbi:kanadaptin [Bombina bombina]|uniref:kanadaptin n=1 Tax=Bombina bombina TaxID=8345 RepID=UPI00235A67EC|nr:kanadaptin [Bombina bombina]
MEAPQLAPDVGQRPCDSGLATLESSGCEGAAGDNAQSHPPGAERAADPGSNERAATSWHGTHERAGAHTSSIPGDNERAITRITKNPGDRITKSPNITNEGPGSPSHSEEPDTSRSERTTFTRTRVNEGPSHDGASINERSGVASINEGPFIARGNGESQWTAGPSTTEGAHTSQPNCTTEGSHTSQPNGERGPITRTSTYEGTAVAGPNCSKDSTSSKTSSREGTDTSGTNTSQEPSAHGAGEKRHNTGPINGQRTSRANDGKWSNETRTTPPRTSTMEGGSDARITDSFKKPTTPANSIGNEKTVEPRAKSAKPSSHSSPSLCSRASSDETAKDASHGLPSDASRVSPAIPYKEPSWSGRPSTIYSLEILKGGSIMSTKSLDGLSWTLFGRLPSCPVSLEHPSVSRYHAVLQYRQVPGTEPDQEPGFYIYDLGSTHGTFLNKQKIPSKTYCRVRVGHVLKFGGSTRLFILQGPEDDQEEECELTVTQIKESRKLREKLQKKMLGEDSDEDDSDEDEAPKAQSGEAEDTGCMWGMGEDAMEDEDEENPIALEFQEDKEALYLKNPKKALLGFFDREGEELEYECEQQGTGTWLCRVRLPADDATGKQLVAEALHSGKKKEAVIQCALEACRILDNRGLLRQEAVSRKRKGKKWEDEDYYDSDDDIFLDRTGVVEKKRLNRMKKAGKIEDKPETFDSLVSKLNVVEMELAEITKQLQTTQTGVIQNTTQDPLDAFMTEIKSGDTLDGVSRKKLHLRSFELKKEQQRLKGLIKIVQPTKLPELSSSTQESSKKKLTLPMFGAMKGGRKFKLKTGTVGKLPPKRTELPASFFNMKEGTNEAEEEEEEEEEEELQEQPMQVETTPESDQMLAQGAKAEGTPSAAVSSQQSDVTEDKGSSAETKKDHNVSSPGCDDHDVSVNRPKGTKELKHPEVTKQRKVQGPSRPPQNVLSTHYPEDDPDYCVWTPPAGQTGDGKTHLNEKYGY